MSKKTLGIREGTIAGAILVMFIALIPVVQFFAGFFGEVLAGYYDEHGIVEGLLIGTGLGLMSIFSMAGYAVMFQDAGAGILFYNSFVVLSSTVTGALAGLTWGILWHLIHKGASSKVEASA